MGYTKVCLYCGKEFETRHSQIVVCSDECKKKRQVQQIMEYRRRRRAKESDEEYNKDKHCLYCGEVFHSARRNKIYCSNKCCNKSKMGYDIKEEKKKKPTKSIGELAREAREHGMDYGSYVVWLERME